MKKYHLLSILVLVATLSFSQEKATGWKELDNFHAIVAPVFHTAEKGNFHAAKDSAALVLQRAKQWQSATIHPGTDATVFKPLIDRLVLECSSLNDAVIAQKTDEELKPFLRKAHNTFHEILGKYDKSAH